MSVLLHPRRRLAAHVGEQCAIDASVAGAVREPQPSVVAEFGAHRRVLTQDGGTRRWPRRAMAGRSACAASTRIARTGTHLGTHGNDCNGTIRGLRRLLRQRRSFPDLHPGRRRRNPLHHGLRDVVADCAPPAGHRSELHRRHPPHPSPRGPLRRGALSAGGRDARVEARPAAHRGRPARPALPHVPDLGGAVSGHACDEAEVRPPVDRAGARGCRPRWGTSSSPPAR